MDENYFNQTPHLLGRNSFKWDFRNVFFGQKDVFPLHVADMDFLSAPPILEAIKKRVDKDILGYSVHSSEHFTYLAKWLQKQHNWNIDTNWCLHSPSAVSSIAIILNAFTQEGDGIIVQTPIYPPFISTVLNFKRKLMVNKLINKNSYYKIDFADFEEKCKEGAKVFIFCSPHNPTGRVWTLEEMTQLASLCLKYNLIIISDELHADLVYKENTHVPFMTISEEIASKVFTLYSPSKTFNLAGLSTSSVIVSDKAMREKLAFELEKFHLYIPNPIGSIAFDAAYSQGRKWYENMLEYLHQNKKLIEDFFANHLPHISISKPQATYLLWINFNYLEKTDKELKNFFYKELKLGLQSGANFGEGGEGFMRLNFALQREKLKEILEKMAAAISKQ